MEIPDKVLFMKNPKGMVKGFAASGLIALFLLGAFLPLVAQTASAANMGNLNVGQENTAMLSVGNPSDSWDFWESLNNHVAVMIKPNTDFDLRIHQNIGGVGPVLASSINMGTNPDLCIWNGNGAPMAVQRSAVVYSTPLSALPNLYDIQYEISNNILPNSPVGDSFNNNDMLDLFQVYLTAGVNYTFKFLSVNNLNADYRFFVLKPNAGQWTNMASPLASGGFWGVTYFNSNYTPPAGGSGYYAVAVMQYNFINTNYQFVVGAPDLTVTGISISPAPVVIGGVSLMPQNRPFSYIATINNQGYGDAGPFNVSSYNDLALWANVSHGGLAARTNLASSFSYNTAVPDTHVLNISADSAGQVAEDGVSGPAVAEGNNNNSRTDCVAELRAPFSNDLDDSVPSPLSYNYYYYAYYLTAAETQTFSLWNASANTDFDMYLYGPTGTLVATAASTSYPERFMYYSASGGYHFIQVLRASGSGQKFTFSVDDADPTIQVVQPGDGTYLKGAQNELRLECADLGSGINDSLSNPVFRVDGGAWTDMAFTVQSGYNYTANLNCGVLIDGNHTLEFMVTDNAGNTITTGEKIVVDNSLPSACSLFDPLPGQYVDGPVTFKVSAIDRIGVAGVSIVFGGSLSGLGAQAAGYDTATGFWQLEVNTGAFLDGPANATPSAVDRAGNVRSQNATAFFIDNHPPSLSLTGPADDAYVTGNDVLISAEASDVAGCITVRARIDGGSWQDMDQAGQIFTAGWNSTAVTDGPHMITVRATDGAGHFTEQVLMVVVDNHAPAAFWGAPDEASFLSGIYTVKIKSFDAVGVRSVVLSIGVQNYPMTFNSGSGYYEYPLDTTALADQEWELKATVSDISGLNADNVTIRNVRVDNGYPALNVVSPGQGEVVSGVYDFDLNAIDAFLERTEFRVDQLGWVRSVSWNTTQHPDGPHTITFRAVDMMGRITEMALGLTIDNSLPSCAFITPANGSFVSGMVTVQVMATDSAGLARIRLNGTGAEPLSFNPVSGLYEARLDTAALDDGTYLFRAECTDMAGHTSSSTLQLRVDNRAPALSVQGPVDLAHLSGVLTILATAPDAFATVMEYQVDNLGWRPADRSLDTTILVNGPHALSVRATDESGKSSLVQLTIYIDNAPPLVSVLTPSADGTAVRGEFILRVAVGETVGPSALSFSLDNGTSTPMLMNRVSGYYEQAVQTSTMSDTITHAVRVKVTSLAGLTTNVTRTFRVDNTPPAVTVRSPTNAAQTGEVKISIDVLDATGITSVQARIDGGQWKDMVMSKTSGRYELKWQTGVRENGYHSFEIRTEDSLGNKVTSAHYFKVENPDYGWAVLLSLLLLMVLVVVAVAVRNRKKRPDELLPPQEPAPRPAPQAPKDFPPTAELPNQEQRAPPQWQPQPPQEQPQWPSQQSQPQHPQQEPQTPFASSALNDQHVETDARVGELEQGRMQPEAARAPTPLEELTASLNQQGQRPGNMPPR